MSNFDEAQGQRYSVSGKEELNLKEILAVLEGAVGKAQYSTKLANSLLRLNLSDYVEEFFVGITHDKNMRRMAEYYESHKPNLTENNPDFFSKFNLTHSQSIHDAYQTKIREEDLVFPIFTNYKMTSLD